MTKTITIRDDVYRRLMAVKRPGESFSELFERLIESAGGSVNVLVKLRGRVEFSDKEKMISEISSLREERR
ncbi:MAG: antitoxin VapB family protein [Candidatus Jordarchaeales archaeon]|nr:antitoxin VapB family protein [Candidatus Jordarchaeia archaeon]